MKSKFLFPTWGILVGFLLAVLGFILGYFSTVNEYEIPGFGFQMREKDGLFAKAFENFTNELAVFLVVSGLILIAFSKNKKEDELNARVRLNALYWSMMVFYTFLFFNILCSILIGEIPFVGQHLFEITIFLPLVIFIVRYGYLKLSAKDSYTLNTPKFLPHRPYKTFGIVFSILSFGILIFDTFFSLTWFNDWDGYIYASCILGFSIWAFSKHKLEDEMTMQLRLESLQLAVYFNYAVLLLGTLLFYSIAYLYVLAFSSLSLLIFFVIRMEYVNFRNNQLLNLEGELSHEK